ncbi:hypothetical protein [Sebaldella sp. S0638]|uniref:hypothetical protein n=1 Tax=Sebaldella sp. S0638 TaxID=2957809 RepID=UPI0020A09946|nr:hypothetical protein [Sebaldella sp. S0638]MCP1223501.1 hypothetical protein [Sebaldella sp. S0638]
MKRKIKTFDYNFKRDNFFSFLKGIIKILFIIYIIFFIIFLFLEKGLTELSLIIPLIPVSGLFLINILLMIYHLIFSPLEISFTKETVSWKTNSRKRILINLSDIQYVRNGLSHSKFNGTYYNDRYTLFLKDGKKYTLDCFMFRNRYIIDKILIDTTADYNENSVKYLQKNIGTFLKTYNEDKYIFYVDKYRLKLFSGVICLILFISLLIYKIFFIGMIFAVISALLLALPIKIILDLKNRNVVFQNIFGFKTADIYSSETKKLIINNKFNISISINSNNPKQKYKSFSLSSYNASDRKRIFEILSLIFENKTDFNLDGKELLF